MKELTIEEKAKAYDEAIKYAHYLINERCKENTNGSFHRADLDKMFPKLFENEDERIKNEIIQFLLLPHPQFVGKRNYEEWIAWIKKQGEQHPKFKKGDKIKNKSASRIVTIIEIDLENREYRLSNAGFIPFEYEHLWELVEPKFKVGNWVVNKLGDVWHIDSFDKIRYQVSNGNEHNYFLISKQNEMRLWTIEDAKDGDVIIVGDEDGTGIAICGKNDKIGNNILYCCYDDENGFAINTPLSLECLLYPATKEQRDLLFSKMREEGYEWDAENKQVVKISNFEKPCEDNEKLTEFEYVLMGIVNSYQGKEMHKEGAKSWSKELLSIACKQIAEEIVKHYANKGEKMYKECNEHPSKCFASAIHHWDGYRECANVILRELKEK